jgi:two-component system, chemotaxis family, protein-glutamate methylesterase/glutaminase
VTGLAVVVDDYALAASPGLERDLALAGAIVMRSFRGLPNPNLLRSYRGAAVVGGPDRFGLLSRLERATASVSAPIIAILPEGVAPGPELRGPGVVDLIPARAQHVAERVLLMANVPIVSGRLERRPTPGAARGARGDAAPPPPEPHRPSAASSAAPVVAIVSSTGGVWVLAALLRDLPARGRVVAVAQHMEHEFVAFFAEWLRGVSGWPTVLVSSTPIAYAPGVAYVPAGGLDLVVEPGTIHGAAASSRYVPSGDRLLRTAAHALGPRAVGVVLSGMGSDGAQGLAEVVHRGGQALCQDPASAVVPSMPESALRAAPGATVASPEALAAAVARLGPETEDHGSAMVVQVT